MGILMLTLIFLCVPGNSEAFCTLGPDGDYYTDENPFVDAKNRDFRLKRNSCPVDKGMTLSEVKVDFDGKYRPQGKRYDIGAYELRQIEAPGKLKVEDSD
ncbi:MAG: choice-of-anchor Q domain-containing protein [Dehalococcoidales bacterium]